MDKNQEYKSFETAMDKLLRANPQVVRAAMEQEKKEREEERQSKQTEPKK